MGARGEQFSPSDRPLRVDVPTNEFGVVIPPQVTECLGEDCKYKVSDPDCVPTRHHLHSSEPYYYASGEEAENFRELPSLRVWLPKCQHEIYHYNHEINVPIPSLEVMRQCVSEDRKIRKVRANQNELDGLDRMSLRTDLTNREQNSINKCKEALLRARKGIVENLGLIEIIPEELVTGALLMAASNIARSRIMMGSGYTLSGIMRVEELPQAMDLARDAEEARALRNSGKEVELQAA